MHYAEILVDQRGFVVTAGVLSGPGRAYGFSAWIVLTLRGFCVPVLNFAHQLVRIFMTNVGIQI